jgi:hypothetical protein
MKSSAPAANTSSAKATAVQTRFTNFMPFCISMIFSPRWWDKLQSRGHKLSRVIAETLPFWVNLPAAELENNNKNGRQEFRLAAVGWLFTLVIFFHKEMLLGAR